MLCSINYSQQSTSKLVDLQQGMITYYPFNGNANDESGNRLHGTVFGATLTSDRFGNQNSAYSFNGISNNIIIDSNFFNIGWTEYSISCWINSIIISNPNSNVGNQCIINTIPHNGFAISFNWGGTNKYSVYENSVPGVRTWDILDNARSSTQISINTWNHIVLVKDSNNYKFYINGILDTIFSGSISPSNYFCKIVFGDIDPSIEKEYFMGKLDDYRIYNRALNNAEIAALYDENVVSMSTPDISAFKNSSFEIQVNANNIRATDNVIAYQFDFNFDSQKLQYQNYSIDESLSENGGIQVNLLSNKLSLAWAGQTPLIGSGTLLKLRFRALEACTTVPVITNFLLNTDTIRNITNGTITINPIYGDVDDNGNIQAYDAAITLQYSVGLDPIPDIDPLPWEDWRITAANVDGQVGITGYDASLILQYTVGFINSFPVHGYKKSSNAVQSDVNVTLEDGFIVFRPVGELYGLNVTVTSNSTFLGSPQILDSHILSATNISSDIYSVGMATAYALTNNDIIMKIPVNEDENRYVTIDMVVNNKIKHVSMGLPTATSEFAQGACEIYPNPSNTFLFFSNLSDNVIVSIYDVQGNMLINCHVTNNQLDISSLARGVYMLKIKDNMKSITKKVIKQ